MCTAISCIIALHKQRRLPMKFNFVAKHMRAFNKASVQKNKKYEHKNKRDKKSHYDQV